MSPLLLQPCQPLPVAPECPDVSGRRLCSCTDERNHEPDAHRNCPKPKFCSSVVLNSKEKWEKRHSSPAWGWGMCSRCVLSPRPSLILSGEFKYLSHLMLPLPTTEIMFSPQSFGNNTRLKCCAQLSSGGMGRFNKTLENRLSFFLPEKPPLLHARLSPGHQEC